MPARWIILPEGITIHGDSYRLCEKRRAGLVKSAAIGAEQSA